MTDITILSIFCLMLLGTFGIFLLYLNYKREQKREKARAKLEKLYEDVIKEQEKTIELLKQRQNLMLESERNKKELKNYEKTF